MGGGEGESNLTEAVDAAHLSLHKIECRGVLRRACEVVGVALHAVVIAVHVHVWTGLRHARIDFSHLDASDDETAGRERLGAVHNARVRLSNNCRDRFKVRVRVRARVRLWVDVRIRVRDKGKG